MSLRNSLILVVAIVVATLSVEAQSARLTAARLKALKASSNDPAGDAFVGSRESLMPLIDDFVADSSMASPMFLYSRPTPRSGSDGSRTRHFSSTPRSCGVPSTSSATTSPPSLTATTPSPT